MVTEGFAMGTPHPELGPLLAFLGGWEGEGEGDYPTIEPFRYWERVTFEDWGKPFLAYTQRTRHATEARPLHAECGYLRPAAGAAEFLIAQPTGIVEVYEGRLASGPQSGSGVVLDLRATTIGLAATAKRVRSLRRRFELDGDRLRYDVWMAHANTPECHHLQAELRRVRP